MKNIEVSINPTEVKGVQYKNAFNKKAGEKIALSIKSEVAIKLNPANPVSGIVMVKVIVGDPDSSIVMEIETITGVVVNTFVDNLDEYIKKNYLPVILMAVNEKVRSLSSILGTPIKLPNPVFGKADTLVNIETGGLPQ